MKQTIMMVFLILLFANTFAVGQNIPLPRTKPLYNNLTVEQQKQVDCLAKNIYFESLNDTYAGMYAVGMVTINRTKSLSFPDDICTVITQKKGKLCQFSWYCDPKKRRLFYDKKKLETNDAMAYNDILKLATNLYLNGQFMNDPSRKALFFHRRNIQPNWRNLRQTVVIGKHIFYTTRKQTSNV